MSPSLLWPRCTCFYPTREFSSGPGAEYTLALCLGISVPGDPVCRFSPGLFDWHPKPATDFEPPSSQPNIIGVSYSDPYNTLKVIPIFHRLQKTRTNFFPPRILPHRLLIRYFFFVNLPPTLGLLLSIPKFYPFFKAKHKQDPQL